MVSGSGYAIGDEDPRLFPLFSIGPLVPVMTIKSRCDVRPLPSPVSEWAAAHRLSHLRGGHDCGLPLAPNRLLFGAEDRNVDKQVLLDEISSFCRQAGMAESTFGRRAVNDGKLISRLRFGGRVTTETLDRVHAFMNQPVAPRSPVRASPARHGTNGHGAPVPAGDAEAAVKGFRFYDNRQKYLSFATTSG